MEEGTILPFQISPGIRVINLPERHSRRAMLARPIARPLVHVRQLARRRFSLAVGSTGTASRTVETRVTAATLGSGSLEVFGTPAMVALMEESACNCVAAALEPGQTTVGTQVNIAHLRCTPMGMGVRAEATLTGIKGKMLTFDVNAFDDKEKIGQGSHQRAIIAAEPFLAQCLAKAK